MNNDRFKDAEWLKINPRILVIGLGGIGSHAVNLLVRSIDISHLTLVDLDIVEPVNLGTQNYSIVNLGEAKVDATKANISPVFPTYKCGTYNSRIEDLMGTTLDLDSAYESTSIFRYDLIHADIIICAVDSMKVRSFLYNYLWDLYYAIQEKKLPANLPLYIDGRLNATSYELFTISPIKTDADYKDQLHAYGNSLVAEETLGEGSCTMRQTYFMGAMIGARITQIVSNYLTNLYYKKKCETELNKPYVQICKVPFHIRELGEAVTMKKTPSLDYEAKMAVYKKED
mgnify:CR=1 FL=1|jgi:hypothetical protein